LFQNRATFDETVQSSPFGDIVPADYNLQLAVLQFANMPDFMFSMADILEKVEGRYDFVLIDCPPAVSVVTTATLVASNYVAIPTEAEYLSLDGVRELAKTVNVARNRLNKNLKVLGLFVVKYNPRRKLTKELEALFSRSAQDIFGAELIPVKIRQTVDIPMAQALQKSIFEYKPQSAVAKEYAEFGEYILGRI
ncbi:MAG: ParA family protein, partial [Christensenellaceae bacterium]